MEVQSPALLVPSGNSTRRIVSLGRVLAAPHTSHGPLWRQVKFEAELVSSLWRERTRLSWCPTRGLLSGRGLSQLIDLLSPHFLTFLRTGQPCGCLCLLRQLAWLAAERARELQLARAGHGHVRSQALWGGPPQIRTLAAIAALIKMGSCFGAPACKQQGSLAASWCREREERLPDCPVSNGLCLGWGEALPENSDHFDRSQDIPLLLTVGGERKRILLSK